MVRVAAVGNCPVGKLLWIQGLDIQLAAQQDKACFFKAGNRVDVGQGQTGFGNLVLIPTGGGAQIAQRFHLFSAKEAEGEAVVFIDKLFGVALRTDEGKSDVLAPKVSQSTPAGSHGVGFWLTVHRLFGGNQHPLVGDGLERVDGKLVKVDRTKVAHRKKPPCFIFVIL